MSSTKDKDTQRSKMDVHGLYREDNFTDRRVGGVQRLSPVKADGSPDESREPVFIGLTHVRSEMGLQPVQCQIEAKTLEEAVEKFDEAVGQALEKMRPPDRMPWETDKG